MAGLQTDWLSVGREGKTWDGRNITAQEITEMAESYDSDLHVAVINYRHHHGWVNLGNVIELRAIEDKQSKKRLQARLEPNMELMRLNQSGQDLQFSMEIAPENPETKTAYLYGLAMTDDPASMGTDQLKIFSNEKDKEGRVFSSRESVRLFDVNYDFAKKEKAGLFSKLFTHNKEDEEMTPQELETFSDNMVQGLTAAMADNNKALLEQFKNKEIPESETPPPGEEKAPTIEEFNTLKETLGSVQETLVQLSEDFKTPGKGAGADGGGDDTSLDDVEGVL